MTTTTPSDKDLDALARAHAVPGHATMINHRSFARALLARYAAPAATVAVQQEPPSIEKLRSDFHQWCATNGYKTRFVEGGECPMGLPVYDDPRTHAAWWAFQKAAKLYATPSTKADHTEDSLEMVSAEPTDHIVDANNMVRAEPGGAEMLVDKKFAAWVASDPVGRSADSRAMSMIMHGWLGREASDRRDGLPFGLVDPDYARIFTIARCLAWADGYAITMHGSFTRDLDLVAVPWAESAREPERLVRRIAEATGTTESGHPPSIRPHGRKTWTLLLPGFSDPRWVDLSVICPRDYDAALRAAMKQESSNG